MCKQIIDFCNGSAKPLIFFGFLLSFLLSITIGYTGCTTQALYQSIDEGIAQERSISYYLQLVAAVYLGAVALLSCQAAYYDQKYSIRALAILSSLNCILALAAIPMIPMKSHINQPILSIINPAALMYNFTDHWPVNNTNDETFKLNMTSNSEESLGRVANSSAKSSTVLSRRWASTEMNSKRATLIWDQLQQRGCCGVENSTTTWKSNMIPKSCCQRGSEKQEEAIVRCEKADEAHQGGCLELIDRTVDTLNIVLVLIALVNLYLAAVTGISTYRTLHYSEASQSAYT